MHGAEVNLMTDNLEKTGSEHVRRIKRTKRIKITDIREIGALVRLARMRLGMSQTDAAICCGVGRRFYVELENGKPSIQLDKLLMVMETLGLEIMVGGPGAAFTTEDLSTASVKCREDEPIHVWQAEFTDGLEPWNPEEKVRRGRTPGTINVKDRRTSAVRNQDGELLYEAPIEIPRTESREEPEERISVNMRLRKRHRDEQLTGTNG